MNQRQEKTVRAQESLQRAKAERDEIHNNKNHTLGGTTLALAMHATTLNVAMKSVQERIARGEEVYGPVLYPEQNNPAIVPEQPKQK